MPNTQYVSYEGYCCGEVREIHVMQFPVQFRRLLNWEARMVYTTNSAFFGHVAVAVRLLVAWSYAIRSSLEWRRMATLLILAGTISTANADSIYAEPDMANAGADIRSAFPGVSLSTSSLTNAEVRAIDGYSRYNNKNVATTGSLVFGRSVGTQNPNQVWAESIGLLRADFLFPADRVQIDLIFVDDDIGAIWAFDANSNLLNKTTAAGDGRTSLSSRTLAVSRTHPDIAYVLIGGVGDDAILLDNLQVRFPDQPVIAPIANAGKDQLVRIGQRASLNATASVDPDGNYPLTFQWTFVTRPTGSSAILVGANSASATFIPDHGGAYVLKLIVKDALGLASSPDTVSIRTDSALVVVEPDHFEEGVSMSEPAAGIHLSIPTRPDSAVQSADAYSSFNDRNLATTGTRVFAKRPASSPNAARSWDEGLGLLRADFDLPVDLVRIDLVFDDDDIGALSAYDKGGNLLDRFTASGDGRGHIRSVTAEISRPQSDIAYILAGGIGAEALLLDNLQARLYATSVANIAPVANSGGDQIARVGLTVNLDGGASNDPDLNFPLTYAWRFISAPSASTTLLLDPDSVNPTFTPDKVGDYVLELVVTDSAGMSSVPDTVTVTTSNLPPIADAGSDQSVVQVGSIIQLDGSASYDEDGHIPLTYTWSILEKPATSNATLSDTHSPTPRLTADANGDYQFQLVVRDSLLATSTPDRVRVAFNNLAPTCNAGGNQSITLGATVTLDGSQTTDANGDALAYQWSLVSQPVGSTSGIANAAQVFAQITPDEPGTYVASLSASDGRVSCIPSSTSIQVIVTPSVVVDQAQSLINLINGLHNSAFHNANFRNALTNKLQAVIQMIDDGDYQNAIDKLRSDILAKTDGCSARGAPDNNDKLINCQGQQLIDPAVRRLIELIDELLP